MEPKFAVGDIVKVVNPESWCYGCDGRVMSVMPTEKGQPYYAVKLLESPNPYVQVSYVMEKHLEAVSQRKQAT